MNQLIRPASLLALALCFGCSGGTAPQTAQTGNTSSNTTAAATPAKPVVVDGVGTEPAQAVAVFLDSLRRGDETAANGVLTSRAREELQKTAYQIQPLGTPEGKYEIGRVGFPYEEKNVALVECQWTEPPTEGMPGLVMEIICEVHRETEGWRISGLGVKMVGSEETLVLDFEDAVALQQTLDGTATPPAQTAGATAPGTVSQDAQTGGQGIPAQTVSTQGFPAQGFPNQGYPVQDPNAPAQFTTQPTGQNQFAEPNQLRESTQFPTQDPNAFNTGAPAQLAFPPLNNAPVQR